MDYTKNDVLEFIKENDVKFVRLSFFDIFGTQKNLAIMSDRLSYAFEYGISFNASSFAGFMNVEESDLILFPIPATLTVLPWRPQQGRVVRFYCDIKHPDGTPFLGDGRYILNSAVKKASQLGLTCKIGSECEFYLFELDDSGNPTKIPHDKASYFDIAPLDKGENVRREICLTLEEMGIYPESSHHEASPGQNEIDFQYSDALTAADHLSTFKSVVKAIAAQHGLHASFMPKPIQNICGNGLHINLSLHRHGKNIFKTSENEHSKEAESFIAGILNRIKEITVFLNPITNSYQRFGDFEAPKYISWSHQNRSQLIRIPASKGDESSARMELCSPDPACNPYISFALLIGAGIEGIEQKLPLCPPTNQNLYKLNHKQPDAFEQLPLTLEKAIESALQSQFVKKIVPPKIIEKYLKIKSDEWQEYLNAVNKEEFEEELYFLYT